MKPPSFVAAPLELQTGVPSPAILRAASAWPANQLAEQMAAVLRTAGQSPPRFVVLATDDGLTADPVAAVLAECLPGRSAVVMAPQVTDSFGSRAERDQLAAQLLLSLDKLLSDQGVLLSQALTPNRQDPATQQFQAADYRCIGELLYLGTDLTVNPTVRIPGLPIISLELVPHSPDDFERWVPLIDRTYVKTLDCPAVDGLRPTREVLIGYRDIGAQRDDWWFIARHDGRDVGCLLLADHRPGTHAELVYMGLVPEVRGQGWGVYLAQQAREITAAGGAQHLVLSVDAANLPALRHYQSAGFQFWEQRTILVKPIGRA
jgi:ribosomal protein S18 acetylase RimI-like enzyme